jgi:hypothetical protein
VAEPPADCAETDAVGRTVDINICSRFAIKFWTDPADRQIKILDLHAADRNHWN